MTTMTQEEKVQKELAKFLEQLQNATVSMGLLRDMMSLTIYSMEQLQTISADLLETVASTGLKFKYPNEWPEDEGASVEYSDEELAGMAAGWPKEDS